MSSKIDKVVQWAQDICADNSHGYSMDANRRWGTPDYDCSSFVISAWEQAGVPVKTYGATYTGNMYDVFLACGFKDVTSQVDLMLGRNLKKGDVLLNIQCHTTLYVGDGMVANARTDIDGVGGDSSGNELRIQPYWNFPWDVCLRFVESDDTPSVEPDPIEPEPEKVLIPTNTRGIGIAMLQGGLLYKGYYIGNYGAHRDGIDGDAGTQNSYTNKATKQAIADGVITEETVDYLVSLC